MSVNLKYLLLIIFIALSLATCSCSVGATSSADIPARNWKMSIVTSEDSSWAKGARLFSDLVKQRTGGKIQIDVYPNGELAGGDQVKELAMLQNGSIDFTYHSNLLYSNLDQAFAVVSLPWLFTDYAQVDAALAGDAGRQLLQSTEGLGIIGLAFGENGFRQLTNNKLTVRAPADISRLKIRIPGVDLYTSIYKALGAEPVKMNFGEVVNALKQGTIDGQENPIDIIESSKLYEVQNYITVWNYSYDALILGINKKDWDGLPKSAQDIIRQAAVEASKEQISLSRESARTQVSLLADQGMTVTRLTTEELAAFRAKVAPVYTEWSSKVGEPFLNQFQGH